MLKRWLLEGWGLLLWIAFVAFVTFAIFPDAFDYPYLTVGLMVIVGIVLYRVGQRLEKDLRDKNATWRQNFQ